MEKRMLGAKLLTYAVVVILFGGFSIISVFCDISTAIGMTSGIISILMFFIYVIGRMWFISHGRFSYRDKIYVISCGGDGLYDSLIDTYIADEIDCSENGFGEIYIVTSVDGVYDLCVNKLIYDENALNIIGSERMPKVIDFVNPGHSIKIRANTPDSHALYEVEFYTYDYKRISASLHTSGKDGSFAGGISIEAGWKSFWYRFLNG